jgi:hypothetical protein
MTTEAEGTGGRDGGVPDVAGLGEITAEGLRQTFPHWRIFPGDGSWWAVRGGIGRWDGPESLLLRALTAPDLTALAEQLCIQDWLDSLTAQELAEVYRSAITGDTR